MVDVNPPLPPLVVSNLKADGKHTVSCQHNHPSWVMLDKFCPEPEWYHRCLVPNQYRSSLSSQRQGSWQFWHISIGLVIDIRHCHDVILNVVTVLYYDFVIWLICWLLQLRLVGRWYNNSRGTGIQHWFIGLWHVAKLLQGVIASQILALALDGYNTLLSVTPLYWHQRWHVTRPLSNSFPFLLQERHPCHEMGCPWTSGTCLKWSSWQTTQTSHSHPVKPVYGCTWSLASIPGPIQ